MAESHHRVTYKIPIICIMNARHLIVLQIPNINSYKEEYPDCNHRLNDCVKQSGYFAIKIILHDIKMLLKINCIVHLT